MRTCAAGRWWIMRTTPIITNYRLNRARDEKTNARIPNHLRTHPFCLFPGCREIGAVVGRAFYGSRNRKTNKLLHRSGKCLMFRWKNTARWSRSVVGMSRYVYIFCYRKHLIVKNERHLDCLTQPEVVIKFKVYFENNIKFQQFMMKTKNIDKKSFSFIFLNF